MQKRFREEQKLQEDEQPGAEVLAGFHVLYALRAEVEAFAARHAAERVAGGAPPAELLRHLAAMQQAARDNDYEAFVQADMSLHRSVAQFSQVPGLDEVWDVIEKRMRDFVAWAHRYLLRDLAMLALSHQAFVEAIGRGDAAHAAHLARVGLDSLWQLLLEQPAAVNAEPDPVERVCAYAMLHLHRPLSVARVAREVAFLSPSQLSRLFQQARKESFTEYVQGLRMRRAALLLQNKDLTVGEIASRVGYFDLSHFAAHFRRYHGCTASDFKANLNG